MKSEKNLECLKMIHSKMIKSTPKSDAIYWKKSWKLFTVRCKLSESLLKFPENFFFNILQPSAVFSILKIWFILFLTMTLTISITCDTSAIFGLGHVRIAS